MDPLIDTPEVTQRMHVNPAFDRVLHIAHHEWHGIRSATAAYPGRKLLISADEPLTPERLLPVLDAIAGMNVTKVIFQGYSSNADQLLLAIKARFLDEIDCFVLTHVTTVQFEHLFEIEQIRTLQTRFRMGSLTGLGSVKPDFGASFEDFYPDTIINFAPNIDSALHVPKDEERTLHVPLDVCWRKNMYTNIVAAQKCPSVDRVKTSNFPTGLADILPLDKLQLTGYLRGQNLLDEMGRSTALVGATLAECQPMTQLEAFAMGTPALTGPLAMREFEADPLMTLCTTTNLDNPHLLSKDIGRLMDAAHSDPKAMKDMIADHLTTRTRLATERLAEFVGL